MIKKSIQILKSLQAPTGILMASSVDVSEGEDAILLESGDGFLLETGDNLLKE